MHGVCIMRVNANDVNIIIERHWSMLAEKPTITNSTSAAIFENEETKRSRKSARKWSNYIREKQC